MVDQLEKAPELAMPVTRHADPDDLAIRRRDCLRRQPIACQKYDPSPQNRLLRRIPVPDRPVPISIADRCPIDLPHRPRSVNPSSAPER